MVTSNNSNRIPTIDFEKINRLALIVGVSNSSITNSRENLQHTKQDALQIARILEEPECNFTLIERPLYEGEADTRSVQKAILKLIENRTDQDFLLFYFSGHAQPVETPGGHRDIYLVTDDFKESDLTLSPHLHLSMSWLREILYEKTKAGAVLLILDCCYAGNILYEKANPYKLDLGMLIENWLDGPPIEERKNWSRLTLTATGYNTFAEEKNGYGRMTYWLIQALRGAEDWIPDNEGGIDINSIHKYLLKKIPQQFPDLGGSFGQYPWILAKYPDRSAHNQQQEKGIKEDKIQQQVAILTEEVTKVSIMMTEISETITDPKYFEKHATTYQDFDHIVCKELSIADLDIDKVAQFFKQERTLKQKDFRPGLSDEELLMRFGLVQNSSPTYGTLLCLGKEPQKIFAGAFVRCTYWNSNDRHSGFKNVDDYRGCLLEQFELACDFLRKQLHLSRIISSEGRKEQWEIPFAALEEALANALVHREYANRTEFVHVEVFDDRIEIHSPGDLPPPMTVQLLEKKHHTHPRNPQIARIFYLYHYGVEQVGTGIQRMRMVMEEVGLPLPTVEVSEDKTCIVTFQRPAEVSKEIFQSEEFGTRISKGIEAIATSRRKTLNIVEEELSLAVGVGGTSLIRRWKRGFIPSSQDQIAVLARAFVESGKMSQAWLHTFLIEARYFAPETLIAELYPKNFLSTLQRPQSKTRRYILVFFMLLLIILPSTVYFGYKLHNGSTPITSTLIQHSITGTPVEHSTIVSAPNGEPIGISNGTFAFDTSRPDGNLKLQASADLKSGNITDAIVLWRQAISLDTNDAEVLIYLEDQQVIASGKPYITFVVGTTLTGGASDISAGQDDLQGAYVAQKEYNDGAKLPGRMLVRLLIANAGGQATNATIVAQEIVQLAQTDRTIIGVMGWPFSAYVQNAVSILAQAQIPMVSPTASSDLLTGISSYFFRVVPSTRSEAIAGALYAEHQLHARTVALFEDPNDSYSSSLASNFVHQFLSDGNQILATEIYKVGDHSNLNALLQNTMTSNPDLIYFAGYADDMGVLLTDLPPNTTVQLMGGDALYELNGYPSSARAGFEHLHFTAFASPDEWLYQHLQTPPFFVIYAQDFDPIQQHTGSLYGYSLPDNDAILAYDAMFTLLQASNNAMTSSATTLVPDELQQNLVKITGSKAIQGIGGQISFGSNGDPINKAIVVLYVDFNGNVQLVPNNGVQGCFLVGHC